MMRFTRCLEIDAGQGRRGGGRRGDRQSTREVYARALGAAEGGARGMPERGTQARSLRGRAAFHRGHVAVRAGGVVAAPQGLPDTGAELAVVRQGEIDLIARRGRSRCHPR